jgi:hypothetical protein
MSTAIAELKTDELTRYAKDRERYSLPKMKALLGDAHAIELERQYLSVAELEETKALALIQANRVLVALNKPEITCWPKGWMDVAQSDCDSCGKPGYCKTVSVGVTFPIDCDACHRCRGEEIDEGEYRLTTPLEVATGFPVYDNEDFWYLDVESSDRALSVAQDAGLDIYDEATSRVLTIHQAVRRLDNEQYGPYEQFSVVLLEDLSLFLKHFCDGLFPELIEA